MGLQQSLHEKEGLESTDVPEAHLADRQSSMHVVLDMATTKQTQKPVGLQETTERGKGTLELRV